MFFKDERGLFYELFNSIKLEKENIDTNFIQDNLSISKKHVIRGLHFQLEPFAQTKLIKVIKGAAIDVAVDIRKSSSTYGQYYKTILNDRNNKMLLIPKGFAHGFLSLEDETIFHYKCSNKYSKENELSLNWNDEHINIEWTVSDPLISSKDNRSLSFKEFDKINPF